MPRDDGRAGHASSGIMGRLSIDPAADAGSNQRECGLIMEPEVDRALDNLSKSGKGHQAPPRRESMSMMAAAGPYADYGALVDRPTPSTIAELVLDPRLGNPSPRHHSVTDFDPMRSQSASNLQNFYASQRYQSRHSEVEQMQQAKRRMAAQRERELRNYHQEQQYHRSESRRSRPSYGAAADQGPGSEASTQGKADRSISPSAMNEEDRRELIARQRRALYGDEGTMLYDGSTLKEANHTPRPNVPPTRPTVSAVSSQGPPPQTYNTFGKTQDSPSGATTEGMGANAGHEQPHAGKGPSPNTHHSRSRANSNSSPSSNNQSFSLFDGAAQPSSRTSTSSPGESPSRPHKATGTPIGGVAPIGTRPAPGPAVHPALNKRSTTPLPSPLSYGFASADKAPVSSSTVNERSTSAASNPPVANKDGNVNNMHWGNNSGVWGKNPLGVQASVWG